MADGDEDMDVDVNIDEGGLLTTDACAGGGGGGGSDAALGGCMFGGFAVVVCMASVVVVGGCAAASVARLGGRVVRVLGTAVHRCPFANIVVKNPAGRFDIAKTRQHQALYRIENQ